MLGSLVYIVLALASLVTAAISAMLGMAGGILLLAVMLCFLSHGEAIPTHAVVQLASNGTRVLAFFEHVDRRAFGRFLLGVLPGWALGVGLLWSLGEPQRAEPFLKALIGAFILGMTFVPRRPVGASAENGTGERGHLWLAGFLAGVAAMTVGTVGPLIAPFFPQAGLLKERLIATKALCQMSTHVAKIPGFLLLRDLNVSGLGLLAGVMVCMAVPGTLLGKRLLKGVSERHFWYAYRAALTLAGVKLLVVDGLMQWI